MRKDTAGFVEVLLLLIIVVVIGVIGYMVFVTYEAVNSDNQKSVITDDFGLINKDISWSYDSEKGEYSPSTTPPDCEDPLVLDSPVNLSDVRSILYPGQVRGNDYKPHGGFRFDAEKIDRNDFELSAIMDGYILKASKYLVGGELQHMLMYVNNCGIMIMHDHLLTLSPELQKVFESIPQGGEGDSRTHAIEPLYEIKKGDLLAKEIGFKENSNVFVDFGLYDLRQTNGVDYSSSDREQYMNINEYGTHALCWFDYLSEEDEATVRALPATANDSSSDYCE